MKTEPGVGERLATEGKKLGLTHLDKPFWPQLGLTKGDLLDYYVTVAPVLLPHLRGRPFVMRPFPDGAGGRSFYRWQIPEHAPPWLHRWRYRAKTTGRTIEMLVIDDLADLVWAVDQACIEMHPWLSRCDDPEHPDRAVFDLDPGPGVGFPACLEVAEWLLEVLGALGLRGYAKTSGRDGLHVLVAPAGRASFREVRQWVRGIAARLAEAHPRQVTLDKSLAGRAGRVLIDYSQNGLGKTIASPYSARATALATVSTPLTQEEVTERRVRPEDFTLLTVPERVRRMGDLLAPLLAGEPARVEQGTRSSARPGQLPG